MVDLSDSLVDITPFNPEFSSSLHYPPGPHANTLPDSSSTPSINEETID